MDYVLIFVDSLIAALAGILALCSGGSLVYWALGGTLREGPELTVLVFIAAILIALFSGANGVVLWKKE